MYVFVFLLNLQNLWYIFHFQENSFSLDQSLKLPLSPTLTPSPQPTRRESLQLSPSPQNTRRGSVSEHPRKYSSTSKRSLAQSRLSLQSEVFFPPKSPSSHGRGSPVTINRTPLTIATPGTAVSDVQRPVSLSSVQPKICQTPSTHLHICDTPTPHLHKETQTDELWVNMRCKYCYYVVILCC